MHDVNPESELVVLYLRTFTQETTVSLLSAAVKLQSRLSLGLKLK